MMCLEEIAMKKITARVLGLAAIVVLSFGTLFADPSMACCNMSSQQTSWQTLVLKIKTNRQPTSFTSNTLTNAIVPPIQSACFHL